MTNQDQLNLAIQAVCLIQQNQMLKQQDAMLRDLIDRVEAGGDPRGRMDRGITTSPIDRVMPRKQPSRKRHLARKKAISRKRQGK